MRRSQALHNHICACFFVRKVRTEKREKKNDKKRRQEIGIR